MSRADTLAERTRPASSGLHYGIDTYAQKEFGCGSGNGYEEPELIRQMKEQGIDPNVQKNYLQALPHQMGMDTKRRKGVVIGNIKEGIDYFESKGKRAVKLERALAACMEETHLPFASQNGRPSETRNPATKNLRSSQYDK